MFIKRLQATDTMLSHNFNDTHKLWEKKRRYNKYVTQQGWKFKPGGLYN